MILNNWFLRVHVLIEIYDEISPGLFIGQLGSLLLTEFRTSN